MVQTELTEDDELAQLLLEAESDEVSTTAPTVLETPSFGDDLINNATSSPKPSSNPPHTTSQTPANGFSDKLNRSAVAGNGENENDKR